MPQARPAIRRLTVLPAVRRGGSSLLMVVYLWIAGVFPVLHAAAEQPTVAVQPASEGGQQGSLPTGHDHLSCHFCTTAAGLVTPPAMHVEALPPVGVASRVPAAPAVESVTLRWAHHAIPSRAPPRATA